jgi:DNA-binding response OmpR family regulator
MTGVDLTRRLRIHTRTTTVPIIVITSETRRHDRDVSIKAGADMVLQKPVSGGVLREHVRCLLMAYGRLPRRLSQTNGFLDSAGTDAHRGNERTCPQCRGLMEYRHKSPILWVVDPKSREPRERLRYVSGWFCSDPACEYQELAQPTG